MMPSGWEFKKLDELADIKGGKRVPKGYSLKKERTNYPYIRVTDFSNGTVSLTDIHYIDETIHQKIANYTINDEDIYISVAGTLGLVGKIPTELNGANLTENANKITNIKIDRNFLLYYLQSRKIQNEIDSLKTTNAQPKLALTRIREFEIAVPPKNEQEKIAKIISTWDEALEKLDKIEEKLKNRHFYLRKKCFTSGDGQIDLKDVAEIIYGKSPKGLVVDGGKFPIVGTSGMVGHTDTPITSDDTVVLGRKGTLNNPIYVVGPCLPIDTTFWTKPRSGYLLRWIFHLTKYLDLSKYNEASGVPSLGRENLYKVKVPNHPDSTQRKIIQVLDGSQAEIDKINLTRKAIQTQKQGLMQQLLTGKKRVKV